MWEYWPLCRSVGTVAESSSNGGSESRDPWSRCTWVLEASGRVILSRQHPQPAHLWKTNLLVEKALFLCSKVRNVSIIGHHVGQSLTWNMRLLHTVESFMLSSVQVLTQLSTWVKSEATFSQDMGGSMNKFARENNLVIALVPGPPESRYSFAGVDE